MLDFESLLDVRPVNLTRHRRFTSRLPVVTPPPTTQVAFIGLGRMGQPMAANVIGAGFATRVHDIEPTRAAALADQGAPPASTVAEAVAGADVVLTSLPGPRELASVGLERSGIAASLTRGAVWADLSTNDLGTGRRLGAAARAAEGHFVDAPVTDGTEGAGAGDTAKITQVILCSLHSVCLTEALILGAKGGVPPHKILDIIRSSTSEPKRTSCPARPASWPLTRRSWISPNRSSDPTSSSGWPSCSSQTQGATRW